MLVSGSMEHVLGPELVEDGVHARLTADGGDHRVRIDIGILLGHHQPDVVLRRLRLVYQHHRCRLTSGNLTDHLGADGACRTRDEDTTAAEHLTHRLHVDLDLLTWQQVFNRNLLQLDFAILRFVFIIGRPPVLHVAVHLDSILRHENLHAHTDEQILQILVLSEVVRSIRRHKHGSDVIVFDHLAQVVFHREHFLTHELIVTQTAVVGDETLQDEATGRLCTDALCQSDATTLCAIDQHTKRTIVGCGHIVDHLHQ